MVCCWCNSGVIQGSEEHDGRDLLWVRLPPRANPDDRVSHNFPLHRDHYLLCLQNVIVRFSIQMFEILDHISLKSKTQIVS